MKKLIALICVMTGLLAACGNDDGGWTQRIKDSLTRTAIHKGFTPREAQCLTNYAVHHWTVDEVKDGSSRARAHGREAALACT